MEDRILGSTARATHVQGEETEKTIHIRWRRCNCKEWFNFENFLEAWDSGWVDTRERWKGASSNGQGIQPEQESIPAATSLQHLYQIEFKREKCGQVGLSGNDNEDERPRRKASERGELQRRKNL